MLLYKGKTDCHSVCHAQLELTSVPRKFLSDHFTITGRLSLSLMGATSGPVSIFTKSGKTQTVTEKIGRVAAQIMDLTKASIFLSQWLILSLYLLLACLLQHLPVNHSKSQSINLRSKPLYIPPTPESLSLHTGLSVLLRVITRWTKHGVCKLVL